MGKLKLEPSVTTSIAKIVIIKAILHPVVIIAF